MHLIFISLRITMLDMFSWTYLPLVCANLKLWGCFLIDFQEFFIYSWNKLAFSAKVFPRFVVCFYFLNFSFQRTKDLYMSERFFSHVSPRSFGVLTLHVIHSSHHLIFKSVVWSKNCCSFIFIQVGSIICCRDDVSY
jgi:hypothetical protein